MKSKFKVYPVAILIPLAVGALSAWITKNSMDIYSTINRPFLSPPSYLFPIVWSVLFILMGISSAIIYLSDAKPDDKRSALSIYAVNLAVNFFWSIIFFNMRKYLFSFIWLILLAVTIIAMIGKFKKISKAAAYLQIPYLLWVIFAGYLNIMIYILN